MSSHSFTEISNNNWQVAIAGAGAGKTRGMIDDAIKEIDNLWPNRFMTIITYTNAATDEISSRLNKRMDIPNNLFIGTIHGFLNRFVLSPYAKILNISTSNIIYVDSVKLNYECKGGNKIYKERNAKISLADRLINSGIVQHDKSIEIAYKITRNPVIKAAIANRLQYVFIDEYQDSTILQHEIFISILNEGKTKFYFTGDPEQYIYSFRYGANSMIRKEPKPNNLLEIPLVVLSKEGEKRKLLKKSTDNKRSSSKVVCFLNNFNKQVQQNAEYDGPEVEYINLHDIDELIKKYLSECDRHSIGKEKKFLLSRNWNTIEGVALKNSFMPLSNEGALNTNKLLSISLGFISAIAGKSIKQIKDETGQDIISLRKLGLDIIRHVKANNKITIDDVKKLICDRLHVKLEDIIDSEGMLDKLKNIYHSPKNDKNCYYSTVHSAKGLEADSVLVIAKTKNELSRWLEKGEANRIADKGDQCRVGFVGFSRARKLLCLACLEKIEDIESQMKELSIVVV